MTTLVSPARNRGLVEQITDHLPNGAMATQSTCDGVCTIWIAAVDLRPLLAALKASSAACLMLLDLTAIDERERAHRAGQPQAAFTVVYHLISLASSTDEVRIKVPLGADAPAVPSICDLWPNANWYEREVWDLFGIHFHDHPCLRRILTPPTWTGHPLRRDHHARATEMPPYSLTEDHEAREQDALRFDPSAWGMRRHGDHSDFMFLNLGPNHPSVHGVFRIMLQLEGERIVDAVPDIGFHHRGAEKMGERQTWHSYIPYTDRVDYLGGVMNNFPYVMAVETLAGITVPPRAQMIRVMLAELFRIASHLVFYGTMAQDVGQLSPVFYMFTDRERVFGIIEAICGFRMHPAWFRIGGVAMDLPEGWDGLIRAFLHDLPRRLDEYDAMVMRNPIFRARTKGIGAYTTAEAVEWGVTGPGLRATGREWDYRRHAPYACYDQLEFDIPTGTHGDCHDRIAVHVEEMRQSLRIIRQCVDNMPAGPVKADHPLTTPPPKAQTMHDIETLIHHFLSVSWGPVIPPGEARASIEATKGVNTYTLISDGGTTSYRTRIRTPSFAHLQMIPLLSRGIMIADLIAILGSIDFVMADVDR
ncbi:NADH-quinone oxidoreductase subunit C/D [Komagataeibacter intermedius]|uniref:NADH-quinone oxidoreductase subunit C/D n=2 Tax=Komagataeibacter intermedius TaxID=66229 RepID=A0A0N0MFZ9_9PROT|nr:NADH-quinone oxidoreductase subunit C/D [Komagataeibacter intermedius]KPH88176.1 bifunctional NADH:ubiquinone oxidoreductase subunit C/D [Komagataeibacter intermedius AF2]MCF3635893.1 NADH-quinone oxidoreductase subunit C/D [Komagataeibacter intermedius]GAN86420.1 bifunctional NADH:ubiquinone oxidoreductase subunit C/D [Komagataeibacter intermedius TF2]GBQ68188.1 NADH-quinone oxidoreductase chain D [Komagataeibacter intermedius NRIC 0521]